MLETEEVDIDYFTPAESTSLASIFGKTSVADEAKETPSLKYVPPPPPDKSKSEEVKPTQWIFTCAVHGFEWINSSYTCRGKLGLAILKVVKTNCHSIILYDSNKATVSYVTISPKLNIHIRDVLTISYYDSAQKYWTIKTSNEDMNKILQLLKDFEATIVPNSDKETDKEQLSNNNTEDKKDDNVIKDEEHKDNHDTDTDFYLNQKTKDSILKRMANMGHSVLPPHGTSKGCASDTSDSNDNDSKNILKHKTSKSNPKKNTDLSITQSESNIVCHSRKSTHRIHMDGQALVHSKNISTMPYGADVNVFISEQKISNSELRIDVNRVSDKLDTVLERLNDVVNIDKCNLFSNFQNDIVQKLIREYENKIKYYEYIMNTKGIKYNTSKSPDNGEFNENVSYISKDKEENMQKIYELVNECKEKDKIIQKLEKEIKVLNENTFKTNERNQEKIDGLMMEIKSLNENLSLKNEKIDTVKNVPNNTKASNPDELNLANKIKKIMNDTFEAISDNFHDGQPYFAGAIKAIIAVVIKKTTMKALEEL